MVKISDLVSFADGPSLQSFLKTATQGDLESYRTQLSSALVFVDQELRGRPGPAPPTTASSVPSLTAVPNADSLPPRARPNPGKR